MGSSWNRGDNGKRDVRKANVLLREQLERKKVVIFIEVMLSKTSQKCTVGNEKSPLSFKKERKEYSRV